MSLNANLVSPPLSPQQQDSALPAALPPSTPDVANPSEPTLSNRAAINSSVEIEDEVNQPLNPITEHSAPEKSDRSSSASSVPTSATENDEITALIRAAQQGNAESQYDLGYHYYFGRHIAKDKEKAVEYFHKAAAQGHLEAQYKLGHMYNIGLCVKQNKEKALEWFCKAAENGSSAAQYALGKMYIKGDVVEKNKEKAFQWFCKAAEKDHAEAQLKLAWAYSTGAGVEVDKEKAFEWCQKAAEQGEIDAMKSLCGLYKDGQGVEKNLPLAAYWKLKSDLAFDGAVEINDGNLQLIAFFPGVLEKFPEFNKVAQIDLQVELDGSLNSKITTNIVKLIRSNSRIGLLTIDAYFNNKHAGQIAEALKFNTQLTGLKFSDCKPSQEIAAQIEVQLTQNRDIAELRKYVDDLHIEKTPGFPLNIVKLMVDKTIVAYLKDGQTKEATKIAIDEMLIIAGMKPLEQDSKIT